MKKYECKQNRGSLLVEVLIAISLFLAISTILAQALFTSIYGGKHAQDKLSMNSLISEQVSKIRALSDEQWNNIGSLATNTSYYIEKKDNKFSVATGTYSGIADGIKYEISFQKKDVMRDLNSTTSSLRLELSSTTEKDNATILIVSTGKIEGNEPIIIESILTRWRNIICSQKDWTATTTSTTTPCETTNINVPAKTNLDMGDQIKLCNGCK